MTDVEKNNVNPEVTGDAKGPAGPTGALPPFQQPVYVPKYSPTVLGMDADMVAKILLGIALAYYIIWGIICAALIPVFIFLQSGPYVAILVILVVVLVVNAVIHGYSLHAVISKQKRKLNIAFYMVFALSLIELILEFVSMIMSHAYANIIRIILVAAVDALLILSLDALRKNAQLP
jgi:uncharacterized membrane protein YecN with MAPEG domain